ncbi:ATP-binding protein [Saliphagus sp. LR7]|uniref:ATP-binding protein n=1 Tax=Saliphagus sp. LR7 TaxID=2282654 RepID=UPI001E4C596E|nr:ATP-binding protein [Saliphagus sp. LR7]
MSAPNRISQIAASTSSEREAYLSHAGWTDNPFTGRATINEYVIPSEGTVADIASALRDYTGPVLIHSRYSGVGKTTLLQMLLDSLEDSYDTVEIGEHNMSAYELSAIIADDLGVGKSSSTKLTEAKIRRELADADRPVLIGIDEFGLNSKDTLHTIQYLNDLPNTRVLLTGMSSQWDAIRSLGSDGRAFQRRVSYEVQLAPFEREEFGELVRRRIATSIQIDNGGWQEVELDPITDDALNVVYDRSHGVPAVATAALSELFGLAAYRYAEIDDPTITADLANTIDYADPEADMKVKSD